MLEGSNISGIVANGPLSQNSWAYASDVLTVYDYNTEKANEILSNLGYKRMRQLVTMKQRIGRY